MISCGPAAVPTVASALIANAPRRGASATLAAGAPVSALAPIKS
eukprot:COSAG03_NODE_3948_length_1748_cov_3.097635_3_plen_43_part_01